MQEGVGWHTSRKYFQMLLLYTGGKTPISPAPAQDQNGRPLQCAAAQCCPLQPSLLKGAQLAAEVCLHMCRATIYVPTTHHQDAAATPYCL